MRRPFYVHTPRNRYGESLVPRMPNIHGPQYTVRSTYTEHAGHFWSFSLAEVDERARQLNDNHESEMSKGMYI